MVAGSGETNLGGGSGGGKQQQTWMLREDVRQRIPGLVHILNTHCAAMEMQRRTTRSGGAKSAGQNELPPLQMSSFLLGDAGSAPSPYGAPPTPYSYPYGAQPQMFGGPPPPDPTGQMYLQPPPNYSQYLSTVGRMVAPTVAFNLARSAYNYLAPSAAEAAMTAAPVIAAQVAAQAPTLAPQAAAYQQLGNQIVGAVGNLGSTIQGWWSPGATIPPVAAPSAPIAATAPLPQTAAFQQMGNQIYGAVGNAATAVKEWWSPTPQTWGQWAMGYVNTGLDYVGSLWAAVRSLLGSLWGIVGDTAALIAASPGTAFLTAASIGALYYFYRQKVAQNATQLQRQVGSLLQLLSAVRKANEDLLPRLPSGPGVSETLNAMSANIRQALQQLQTWQNALNMWASSPAYGPKFIPPGADDILTGILSFQTQARVYKDKLDAKAV
jgi:hypothetical protein